MKDLYYVAQEITKGKNLSTNLLKYATGMSSMYRGLGFIKLSMNYYTIYDMLQESPCDNELFKSLFARFNAVLDRLISEDADDCTEIENIRNEIIGIMEVVTQYVDRFRIYEYVLNRVEHRFDGQEPDEEYYGMYLTNDLMHYILADKDNVVINSRIAEVIEQLPMRLSRNKFYEYLRDAFTLYHGAQKGTVDDYAYGLRTTAMLEQSEGFDTFFEELYDLERTLAAADYTSMDMAEYKRLSGALSIATEKVTGIADVFVLLESMVNDVYTILLTKKSSLDDISEIQYAKEIISEVLKYTTGAAKDISDELESKFEYFEGKQERILMILSKSDFAIETAIDKLSDELQKYELTDAYGSLAKVIKLQSGSEFVSLSDEAGRQDIAEDSYVDEVCEKLIEQLKELFKEMPVMVRRAVMSAVVAQLPVFFNNTDEICNYINLSLEQCNDKAERVAVIEVLKMVMQN